MNCKFSEKISLMIDGELTAEETQQVKAHLTDCAECGQLESDYLYLRQQIKESVPEMVWEKAEKDLFHAHRKKMPFWRKRILIPAPAFVLFLFVLIAIAVWAIYERDSRKRGATAINDPVRKTPVERQPQQNAMSEISLSRFDKGGRTEIYTVRHQTSTQIEKTESIKQ
jgi:hypothetical protein